MTSSRHHGSRLRAALRRAVVACASLGAAAASASQPPPAAPAAQQRPAAQQPQPSPALALVPAWTTPLPGPPASPPARDGERLYLALRSGAIVAIELASGGVAWERPGAPDASVAAGDGLVFVALPEAVVALEPTSGAERWRHEITSPVAGPPSWNNGWLLIGSAGGRVEMLRAGDGRPIWERELGAALRPGAMMTGDRLYAMLDDGRVVALTLARGEPIWERSLPAAGTALAALDDRVFVGAEDRFFYCLSSGNGKVKWRWRTGGAILGTPAVDADAVYFLAFDNVLRALDRGNGHQRWKRGLSFRPIGGPVLGADLLLVPGSALEIPAFRSRTGAPAGKITVTDEPASVPLLLPGAEPAAPAATGPGPNGPSFSLVLVTAVSVQRLGPAPPVLESHPIPGVPLFLLLPQRDAVTP